MTLRRRVAASRYARAAALPFRAAQIGRYDGRLIADSTRWLFTSREVTNFTYDLTATNRSHLAWWVAGITGSSAADVRNYFDELTEDQGLANHIRLHTANSSRHRLADTTLRWHRYLGWYALVRALRPQHIVETGTDKGRGTLVFAAAVLRNGTGRVTTIDNNPDSGYLIKPPYDDVVTRVIGDSIGCIEALDHPVDFFLHDSLHTREHESREIAAITPMLSSDAVVLSDNAHSTDVLASWAEVNGWSFSYFQERPVGHWYPGAGIGLARNRSQEAFRESDLTPEV